MKFTSFDMEFADIILPSIDEISMLDWYDNTIISSYFSKINPDTDIEEWLGEREKLTDSMLLSEPYIEEIWIKVFNNLNHKIVFAHNANQRFQALLNEANATALKLPDFIYFDSASLAHRTWPNLKYKRLADLSENLGISYLHYNAYEDAKSVGRIVNLAGANFKSITEMYKTIGIAGGIIYNNKRYVLRTYKHKNIIYPKIIIDGDIKYINLANYENNLFKNFNEIFENQIKD